MTDQVSYPVSDWAVPRRIAWGAVFGGVMIALGTALLLASFGTFIGFRLTGSGAATWSVIWYFITAFCALFAGGWATARLAAPADRGYASLHGLVCWGLTCLSVMALELSMLQTTAITAQAGGIGTLATRLGTLGSASISDWSLVMFIGTVLAALGALAGAGAGSRSGVAAPRTHTAGRG